jgi:hypothetical protein
MSFWRVKKTLGLSFDLIDAYGAVLEKHCDQVEPIEVLPASKSELKLAILSEAMRPEVLRNEEYRSSLLVAFLSLSHFQHNPRSTKAANQALTNLKSSSASAFVDKFASSDMAAHQLIVEVVQSERRQLAAEWSAAFESLASAVEERMQKNVVK